LFRLVSPGAVCKSVYIWRAQYLRAVPQGDVQLLFCQTETWLVLSLVLFLVSGLSGYVTGQRVEVDGGGMLRSP